MSHNLLPEPSDQLAELIIDLRQWIAAGKPAGFWEAIPPEHRVSLETILPTVEKTLKFLPGSGKVSLEIGKMVDSYLLLKGLGTGGFGTVFQALDVANTRLVALKFLLEPRNEDSRRRFKREAEAFSKIDDPHVVRVYRHALQSVSQYICMEYLEGETLANMLDREKPLPYPSVLKIGLEIAQGLAAVHKADVIHRDIKPNNIWIEAKTRRTLILDLGLSRQVIQSASPLTQQHAIVGTLGFIPPEDFQRQPRGFASDLFCLGCVLYYASTGEKPFSDESYLAYAGALVEPRRVPVEINPELPLPFSDLLIHLLETQPTKRPQTAIEVQERLKTFVSSTKSVNPLVPGNRGALKAAGIVPRELPPKEGRSLGDVFRKMLDRTPPNSMTWVKQYQPSSGPSPGLLFGGDAKAPPNSGNSSDQKLDNLRRLVFWPVEWGFEGAPDVFPVEDCTKRLLEILSNKIRPNKKDYLSYFEAGEGIKSEVYIPIYARQPVACINVHYFNFVSNAEKAMGDQLRDGCWDLAHDIAKVQHEQLSCALEVLEKIRHIKTVESRNLLQKALMGNWPKENINLDLECQQAHLSANLDTIKITQENSDEAIHKQEKKVRTSGSVLAQVVGQAAFREMLSNLLSSLNGVSCELSWGIVKKMPLVHVTVRLKALNLFHQFLEEEDAKLTDILDPLELFPPYVAWEQLFQGLFVQPKLMTAISCGQLRLRCHKTADGPFLELRMEFPKGKV